MSNRKAISASLRWKVFQRDDFRCRYCGRQAGEEGVVLHVDHVMSVADGGSNALDNLVTACQRCNGGKGAKTLESAPGSVQAIEHARTTAATLKQQADALAESHEARRRLEQSVVNLVCDAYGITSFRIASRDLARFVFLVQAHGPDPIADWVSQAARRRVKLDQLLRYVHGIIRKIREENGALQ